MVWPLQKPGTNPLSQKRFGVTGFPTIKFLSEEKVYAYKGARDLQAFVQYATEGYVGEESEDIPSAPTPAPLAAAAPGSNSIETSDVVVLTDANFDTLIESDGDWLVEFYAPWCGHCKKLAPIYEEVATELKGKVNVAKLDATANPRSQKRFGVTGFPTLKFFSKGKVYPYEGARGKEDLITYAEDGFRKSEGVDMRIGLFSLMYTSIMDGFSSLTNLASSNPFAALLYSGAVFAAGWFAALTYGPSENTTKKGKKAKRN